MNNGYTVYMHISPSNKRYIGITKQSPNRRWRDGKAYKQNFHFTNAIKKYGWDNFQHVIIVKGLSKEIAEWLEIELIRVWDSTNQDKGYNLIEGGSATIGFKGENHPMFGKHHTEDTKRKISEANSGENHPFYGKHHSKETKEKLRNANIGEKNPMYGKRGENHPMYGVHRYGEEAPNYGNKHTDETKEKMRKSVEEKGGFKRGNNPSAKKIICLETMEIFDCIKDASQKMNCCYTGLVKAIKNNKKYKGYTFIFYEDYKRAKQGEELK